MCGVTHSCVWCDSFMCVMRLIHVCGVTHSCVWCKSFTWRLVHCVAVRCSVTQCLVAICCSALQHATEHSWCGVASIGRFLKIIGLFCRISSFLQGSFAKETYNLRSLLIVATPDLHTPLFTYPTKPCNTATLYHTLHHTTTTLQHTATTHCNTLQQHTATTHCNSALQHTAIDDNAGLELTPCVHGDCHYTLQHTATHCIVLQYTATHIITLYCTATQCKTLHYTATHCSRLHYNTTHSNALHYIATHCNTLHCTVTHCSTLQHTATHCNTLQRTATHCNTLWYIAIYCNTLQQREKNGNTGLRMMLCAFIWAGYD